MQRLLFVTMMIVLIAGVAAAQDFPRVEVFGGYSLLKLGGKDLDNLLSEIESTFESEGTGVSASSSKWFKEGFDASAAFNVNEYFGIEANFLYNRGDLFKANVTLPGGSIEAKLKAKDFAFMAGPRFTSRKNERVTPFAHALFGFDHVKIEPSVAGIDIGDLADIEASDTGFGLALGGGLDVNVNKSFGIRLIQADYFMAKHDEATLQNLILSFGVVFRLGGK